MATLKDVARAANVDVSAVSFALSGKGNLSAETRERILRFARELNYRPNLVARSLAKRRTETIGLLVPDLVNPYYSMTAQAATRAAHQAGYRVAVMNTDADQQFGWAVLEDMVDRQLDGIIVMGNLLADESIRAIVPPDVPLVWCGWESLDPQITPAIVVDYDSGGRLVAEHLLALGHRRMAVVAPPVASRRSGRFHGFVEALATAGYPFDAALWAASSGSDEGNVESGWAAGRTLLALPSPPTAVVAHNDFMALGVLAAARERGLRVPEDLSLVGFDDVFVATFTAPPLTTVRYDTVGIAVAATTVLLAAVGGGEPVVPAPFEPELVVRKSTGPAGFEVKDRVGWSG
jgi:DNA-binding LacI/PurR family transcriptional regulator